MQNTTLKTMRWMIDRLAYIFSKKHELELSMDCLNLAIKDKFLPMFALQHN